MTTQQTDIALRKSITVSAPPDRAFEVFAERTSTWWPEAHHIGKSPFVDMVIEPHAGGRCFERDADGVECDWGTVLEWQPPTKLRFAWQLTSEWAYEPDVAHATEVTVSFTSIEDGRTRVEVLHEHLERYGAAIEEMRAALDAEDGWALTLSNFAAVLGGAE